MADFHVIAGHGDKLDKPMVNKVGIGDLFAALSLGARDFWEKPSHYALIALIYPLVGVVLTVWMNGYHTWPLLYPLIGGFALLGPLAALPLYEVSRRRELGLDTSWHSALAVLRSPAMGSILAVGAMLFVLFTLWLTSAQTLYEFLFGSVTPRTLTGLWNQVMVEPGGTTLIIVGTILGGVFALVALATSVVAFPLLLDRDVGAYVAVETSLRVFATNPVPVLAWGVIIAVGLVLAMLPLFIGLALVLPIFGHATWHLYRRAVDNASELRGRH